MIRKSRLMSLKDTASGKSMKAAFANEILAAVSLTNDTPKAGAATKILQNPMIR
jgi:hypothetical protein